MFGKDPESERRVGAMTQAGGLRAHYVVLGRFTEPVTRPEVVTGAEGVGGSVIAEEWEKPSQVANTGGLAPGSDGTRMAAGHLSCCYYWEVRDVCGPRWDLEGGTPTHDGLWDEAGVLSLGLRYASRWGTLLPSHTPALTGVGC